MRRARLTTAIATGALLALGAGAAAAAPGGSAGAYCQQQGGVVQFRTPTFGTNTTQTLPLGGRAGFCRWRASDGSRIYVGLATLTSRRPTLAVLAYLTRPKLPDIPPSANPASVYCSSLGGSDQFGGANAAGGGWVLRGDPFDPVLEACMFPDGSIIDSWGLTYHQRGVVRGKNLTKVFRYRSANPPKVFS